MTFTMLCAQANSIDLVNYLQEIGFSAQKVRGDDWWYLSPLRKEKTPSFKVNRRLNLWYDHGLGRGGNLIDFGVLYFRCTVKELLQKLSESAAQNFSFHPHISVPQKDLAPAQTKLKITAVRPLWSLRFHRYLGQRKIAFDLAKQYVKEVSFELNGKPFSALGFQNNSGGFELRSEHFKGSSSPKDVTLLCDQDAANIAVFEGFFSFLSYLSLTQMGKQGTTLLPIEKGTGFLILNSLSFFEKSRTTMERYPSVHLYLDRDTAGIKATAQALQWSTKYQDRSAFYKGHKDLNDYLIQRQKAEHKQGLRRGRHF